MELQHSIACSGVVIESQSNAYAASNTAITATNVSFANLIHTKLLAPWNWSQGSFERSNPLSGTRAYKTPANRQL
jgi:hypothetical protein